MSTAVLGLTLGVTRSIAVFGRLPLARARMQTDARARRRGRQRRASIPGPAAQDPFFAEFDAALSTLEAQIAAGAYDGDPARRALADATLAEGDALFGDLFTLLGDPSTASPFVPTGGSEAGTALAARIAALQATLATDLGVGGFVHRARAARRARDRPTSSRRSISDPAGPIGIETGRVRGDVPRRRRGRGRGDARRPMGPRRAPGRLPRRGRGTDPIPLRRPRPGPIACSRSAPVTGRPTSSSGAWWTWAPATSESGWRAGTTASSPADVIERVAPPSQPFPARSLLTSVRLDPGDVTTLAVRPFFRLARTFALIGSLERWSRGEDAVEYRSEADAIPGVDPSVLAQETDASATLVSIGVTYSNPGALRPGGTGLPVDAGWTYERIVSASGGIVPDTHRIRARLRLYFGIW